MDLTGNLLADGNLIGCRQEKKCQRQGAGQPLAFFLAPGNISHNRVPFPQDSVSN
jgi:hypothetical protein